MPFGSFAHRTKYSFNIFMLKIRNYGSIFLNLLNSIIKYTSRHLSSATEICYVIQLLFIIYLKLMYHFNYYAIKYAIIL